MPSSGGDSGRAAERSAWAAAAAIGAAERLAPHLGALSRLYGGYQRLRRRIYAGGFAAVRRLPCPVVSVGNLTVGGTGKTPLAIDLAGRLLAWGLSPAVVSRGYRGACERRGGIVSDGRRVLLGPEDAGDEPFLIARRLPGVPVVVGRDRFRAGRTAWERFRPDVLILDDGFQHLRVRRDLDLVLIDHRRPFGNGRLLPSGPLREPIEALGRADAIVVTRAPAGAASLSSAAAARILTAVARGPVFFTRHAPRAFPVPKGRAGEAPGSAAAAVPPAWRRRRAFAFSGIARHDDFLGAARRLGFAVASDRPFPDHHRYAPSDRAAILEGARAAGADLLLTTEKDHARLAGAPAWPLDLVVVGVDFCFGGGEAAFDAFLRARLEAARRVRAGLSPSPPENSRRRPP